ncbi:helix-turn-helix transcriptional regulator [Elizabethkingia anophelis]|nr:helix-turn-helix transcriptional regulator [Elizabethkingia anophelis]
MTHTDMPNKKIHQGRNIKRFREMLGIKQDALAYELGEDWNQKKISLLEQKETIETSILQQVSAVLKIPVEAIENFDEEQAVNIIANTITNNDNAVMHSLYINNATINPVEKWLEALEENKKLYERWLEEKNNTISVLEEMLRHWKQ